MNVVDEVRTLATLVKNRLFGQKSLPALNASNIETVNAESDFWPNSRFFMGVVDIRRRRNTSRFFPLTLIVVALIVIDFFVAMSLMCSDAHRIAPMGVCNNGRTMKQALLVSEIMVNGVMPQHETYIFGVEHVALLRYAVLEQKIRERL